MKNQILEILKVLEKNKDIISGPLNSRCHHLGSASNELRAELWRIELEQVHGIAIEEHITTNKSWFNVDSQRTIGIWGEKHNRTISWSVDGTQPVDEHLYRISFSTGPYFFGDDYASPFFDDFIGELAAYGPKYRDNANSSLYFEIDKAADIHRDYDGIVEKHREKYRADANIRKADRLRAELAKLEM